MTHITQKIGGLYRARDEAVKRRDEADAEIKRLDRLLNAVDLLKSAGIVDVPDDNGQPRTALSIEPVPASKTTLSGSEAEKIQARDETVLSAITGHYPRAIFTVPDLTPLIDVSKRSIKRALDDMIDRGEVELVEQGFKRRPTKYRLVHQAHKDDEVEAQDSPEN